MAVQTNYSASMAAAYAGMIASTEPNELISRNVETAAGIGFAVPVIQGTKDNDCDVVSAAADDVIGITVRDQSVTADKFAQTESALLMRKGPLWVPVAAAGGVSAGDDVWVTVADGTFTNADAGSSGSIKLPGCRWETSAANGELAQIRVNLDVPAEAGGA